MPIEQLIYTDAPRGQGLDPSLAGFQVRAASPGLGPADLEVLGAVCRHYGDAVYRSASSEALDRESAWRERAEPGAALPADVLALFPEIWSYDALGGDRFALTRVRYAGVTHDGRFGNFFAHALVVSARDVETLGSNPLALARSGLVLERDPGGPTRLPPLEVPASTAVEARGPSPLLAEPFRGYVEELVGAACLASSSGRPVLVRVGDWRDGERFVAGVLDALPPPRRCRTTFCTLENDRRWLPPAGPVSKASGAVAAHDLIVMGGRSADIRPDEYRSSYVVFNFAEGRFSDAGAPGAYAVFAGRCVRAGDRALLARNHEAIERLCLGLEPAAWDALVGVEELFDGSADAVAIARHAAGLAAVVVDAESGRRALDLLVGRLARLDRSDRAAWQGAIASVWRDLARLAERASEGDWLEELRALAIEALAGGLGRAADSLLGACGPHRSASLLAVFQDVAGEVRVLPSLPGPAVRARLSPAERDELAEELRNRERLATIAFEAADIALAGGDAGAFEELVETALVAARSAGALDETWERSGRERVAEYFEDEWDDRRRDFAEKLATVLSPDVCPEGAAWLAERALEAAGLTGRARVAVLARLARAGSGCKNRKRVEGAVLRDARASFAGAARCEALGRAASAARGTASAGAFFEAYLEEARTLGDDGVREVRRALVAGGAADVPAREALAQARPWGELAFDEVWDGLGDGPAARDALCRELAGAIAAPDAPAGAVECAIVALERGRGEASAARAELLEAVALAVPMRPPSNALAVVLEARSEMSETAARRLEAIALLGEVAEAGRDPRWSAGKFLARFGIESWPPVVRALRLEDKQAIVAHCLGAFEAQGIQTPEDAEGFVLFMEAAGEATVEEITASVMRMLDGRDQVTLVVAARAFAECALGASKVEGAWGEILRRLLEAFDKETRRAFERHMALGFGRDAADARIEALARAAGFTAPSEAGARGLSIKPPASKSATGSLLGGSRWFFSRKETGDRR